MIAASRRNLESQLAGNAHQPRCRNDGVGGVGIAEEEADAIAGLDVGDSCAERFDYAHSLAAEKCGKFIFTMTSIEGLAGEFTPALLHVEEIHAGGMHAHQRFPAPAPRRRHSPEPPTP